MTVRNLKELLLLSVLDDDDEILVMGTDGYDPEWCIKAVIAKEHGKYLLTGVVDDMGRDGLDSLYPDWIMIFDGRLVCRERE